MKKLAILLLFVAPLFAQQPTSSPYNGMKWRLIGPFRGGRALTATGVAGDPKLFYFGSVGGGVWRSTDAGNSWVPIFDDAVGPNGQKIASIGAIAIAPSDANVIYVGTGEADMRSDIAYGNGIYRSRDGGAHWQYIGLGDSRQIGKIIVDPKDANRLFVAALGHAYGPNSERGVFRSTDGGAHWQRVLFKNDDTGAIDLAFSPADPNTIYASLWQTRRPPWNVYPPSNGPGSGLFKSTDGGNTWQQLTNGLPPSTAPLGHIGITVSPTDPNRIYLCVDAGVPTDTHAKPQGGIFRSDDGGASFKLVNDDHRLWQRGWYFGGITADTHNPDVLYIANTSTWRSEDGGKNFVAIKGAPGGDDYHSVWVAPDDSNRIIIASDQGTIVSLNRGETWSSWYNQPTGQMYHAVVDNRFPYWVYGSQQDSGAITVPSRSNYAHISEHDWKPISVGGESGSITPDPNDPDTLYGGTVSKWSWETFEEQDVSPTLGKKGTFRRTWTLPLTFSPDGKRLYGSHQQIFETTDGGRSWQQVSPDLTREEPGIPQTLDPPTAQDVNGPNPRKGVVYAIAPSPLDAKLVWAGTDDGLIHITRDDGMHWQDVTPRSITPWSKVGVIEASHFNAGTAYAAIDRHRLEDYRPHVLRTRDFGKTWTELDTGIPDGSFVNVVREDTVRAGLLYAGTELGVYVSFDDGAHWEPLQLNLPTASVRDIVVKGDDLVVATHGRAFWILDDIAALRDRNFDARMLSRSADSTTALFVPQAALRVRPPNDQGTPQPPEIAKGDNPPSGAILDYYIANNSKGEVTLDIHDVRGNLVRHWSSEDKPVTVDAKAVDIPMYWFPPQPPLSAAPGLHRWLWDMHYAAPEGASARRRRGG